MENKNLESKASQENSDKPKPLFENRPWRDTTLYSIDENGYYISEHHPIATKVVNTYLRVARWLWRVEYK